MFIPLRYLSTGAGYLKDLDWLEARVYPAGAAFVILVGVVALSNVFLYGTDNVMAAAFSVLVLLSQLIMLDLDGDRVRAVCLILVSYSVLVFCLFSLAHLYLAGAGSLASTDILWIYVVYNAYVIVCGIRFILAVR